MRSSRRSRWVLICGTAQPQKVTHGSASAAAAFTAASAAAAAFAPAAALSLAHWPLPRVHINQAAHPGKLVFAAPGKERQDSVT